MRRLVEWLARVLRVYYQFLADGVARNRGHGRFTVRETPHGWFWSTSRTASDRVFGSWRLAFRDGIAVMEG